MYRYEDIKALHLEITSRCNAACPMCPRNLAGGRTNPNLPLTELRLADIEQMFPDDFVRQLDRMYMCGNYGDAMVAHDTLEIFEHFRRLNPKMKLRMMTNASGRTEPWWRRLAGVLDACVFSIDGLEDTNHLYRRRTDWRLIMRSIEWFIAAGGKAEWEFLVFRHNEHQVEEARELARRLGFKKFTAKRTERFLLNGRRVEERPVLDLRGNVEYAIGMPRDARWHNDATSSVSELVQRGTAYRSYAEQTDVHCKAVEERKIFASAEGLVFPCCWAGGLYSSGLDKEAGEIWRLIKRLPEGKHSLSALRHPLREIVAGPFFQSTIPDSWVRDSPERKEFTVCARMCGRHDPHRAVPEQRA